MMYAEGWDVCRGLTCANSRKCFKDVACCDEGSKGRSLGPKLLFFRDFPNSLSRSGEPLENNTSSNV